jgi:tRNA U34 2-thiouridine synthase MnmA/TrmU
MDEIVSTKLAELPELREKKYDVVSLYSGGLDSVLALEKVKRMGLSVLALKIELPFSGPVNSREPNFSHDSKQKIDILTWFTQDDYTDLIRNPRWGFGSNMNPCIDCKVHFFTIAKSVMNYVGAKAVVTGEVAGQRPMSQNKDTILMIEKNAGMSGMILRPLTGLNFAPTELEKQGTVKREQLLGFSGRGRRLQFELAKDFGIKQYQNPAGGCLLTDPAYSFRLKECMRHNELSLLDLQLLKWGRHFRLPGGSKLILGRDQSENEILKDMFPPNWVKFDGIDVKGPWAGIPGSASLYDLKLAAQIWARYSQGRDTDPLEMRLIYPKNKKQILITHPLRVGQELPYIILPPNGKQDGFMPPFSKPPEIIEE